jgi:hypothetical protein
MADQKIGMSDVAERIMLWSMIAVIGGICGAAWAGWLS